MSKDKIPAGRKFVVQYSVWKQSCGVLFVIASCTRTHAVRFYTVLQDLAIFDVLPPNVVPDLRDLTPCKYSALSPSLRARITARFQQDLEQMFGVELPLAVRDQVKNTWAQYA